MAHHRVQQWATFARQWWLFDAAWQNPFRCAPEIIKYISGKHKPIYHPHSDTGDHVVVINTREIALEDEMWRTFLFHHDTGYVGGKSTERAWQAHEKDPTFIFRRITYGQIKGDLLRRPMMERLHLFPDGKVPDEILKNVTRQIRQVRPAPKRLDQYTAEERAAFPRLFELPEEYVLDGKAKEQS